MQNDNKNKESNAFLERALTFSGNKYKSISVMIWYYDDFIDDYFVDEKIHCSLFVRHKSIFGFIEPLSFLFCLELKSDF